MRLFVLVFMAVVIVTATSSARGSETQHPYFQTGTVESISGQQLQFGGATLFVIEKCKYVAVEKRNGAYYENPATKNDVRAGDSVMIRMNGNVVDQIHIERWKR